MTYAEIVRAVKRYGYAIVAKDFDGTKWLAVARADPELPAGVSIYLTFREIRPSVWTLTVDYIGPGGDYQEITRRPRRVPDSRTLDQMLANITIQNMPPYQQPGTPPCE